MVSERDVIIWLNSLGIASSKIEEIKLWLGDLTLFWTLSSSVIRNSKILKEDLIAKLLEHRNLEFLNDILLKIKNNNINVVTALEDDYPERLKNIPNKPAILYCRGTLNMEDNLAIAIVGSRKATAYGKWACERFTKELAEMGITIVSGLATGIDTYAHKMALETGGRTIGVLGNGLDIIYPKNNQRLYKEVAENGCVLSEFPLGTDPFYYNFPQRNRIISGLSLGIIVVEAKEKSGSLITAHHGLDQGKDVFAVPGNINSIYSGGTNKLIKDGATPLLSIDDILEEIYELQIKFEDRKKTKISFSELSEDEEKIIKIILDGPVHSDIISIKTGLDISMVISILTGLELKGIIKELSSRIFTIC